MTFNKRRKHTRARANSSHGWGSKKKRRGAGNRGGRGMAGTGKRAAQKKPTIINTIGLKQYFGRQGFTTNKKKLIAINIIDLNKLAKQKKLKKQDGSYEVDLKQLGYHRVLGRGKPDHTYIIKGGYVTKKAAEKLKLNVDTKKKKEVE